jgi:hypothetical protein
MEEVFHISKDTARRIESSMSFEERQNGDATKWFRYMPRDAVKRTGSFRLCPHGFECCNKYRFRYKQMPGGIVVTWNKGSLTDDITMRLEQCALELAEARRLYQQFIEHGHCIRELWSATFRRTVSLTSHLKIREYLRELRGKKLSLEEMVQAELYGIIRRPGKPVLRVSITTDRRVDFDEKQHLDRKYKQDVRALDWARAHNRESIVSISCLKR